MCWYGPIPDLLRNAPVLESMAYTVEKSIEKRSFRWSHYGVKRSAGRYSTVRVFQALFSCVQVLQVHYNYFALNTSVYHYAHSCYNYKDTKLMSCILFSVLCSIIIHVLPMLDAIYYTALV